MTCFSEAVTPLRAIEDSKIAVAAKCVTVSHEDAGDVQHDKFASEAEVAPGAGPLVRTAVEAGNLWSPT